MEPLTTAATMPQGIGGQLPHHAEEEQEVERQEEEAEGEEEKENQDPRENTMMMMTQQESQVFHESHREEPSTDLSTGMAAEVLTNLEYWTPKDIYKKAEATMNAHPGVNLQIRFDHTFSYPFPKNLETPLKTSVELDLEETRQQRFNAHLRARASNHWLPLHTYKEIADDLIDEDRKTIVAWDKHQQTSCWHCLRAYKPYAQVPVGDELFKSHPPYYHTDTPRLTPCECILNLQSDTDDNTVVPSEEEISKPDKEEEARPTKCARVTFDIQDTLHFNAAVIFPFQARDHDNERWLLDSGSTVHVTNNPHGITHWRKARETIVVGNGQEVKANFKGTVHLQVKNVTLTLHNVLFVPGFAKNIINVSHLV